MFKIPSNVVKDFLESEVGIKTTNDPNEVRIKSIYEQDTKYKCYISLDRFQFCDFKAGISGSCYNLFRDILGVESNREVMRYVMKNYGNGMFLQVEQEINKEPESSNNIIEEFSMIEKPIYFKDKDKIGVYGKQCLRYLMDRKIDVEYIRKMGYVFNPESKFNKRIIIPYIEDGRMAYFQARSIDKNNSLRYLNPAGLDTKAFVFNYDKLNDDELIICEGPFDAMSMDEQTATCMCSGDLSSKQLIKIFGKAKPKTIIYVPDQDETGMAKMDANIQRIYTYADYSPKILIYNIGNGCKDLNELKVKTGKNYILKKECVEYTKHNKRGKHLWEE